MASNSVCTFVGYWDGALNLSFKRGWFFYVTGIVLLKPTSLIALFAE